MSAVPWISAAGVARLSSSGGNETRALLALKGSLLIQFKNNKYGRSTAPRGEQFRSRDFQICAYWGWISFGRQRETGGKGFYISISIYTGLGMSIKSGTLCGIFWWRFRVGLRKPKPSISTWSFITRWIVSNDEGLRWYWGHNSNPWV